jgi:hypothetical protein
MLLCCRFRPLLHIITPPGSILAAIIGLMIVENGLGLLVPWIAGQFTQTVFNGASILQFSY